MNPLARVLSRIVWISAAAVLGYVSPAVALDLKFNPVAPAVYAFIGELGPRTVINEDMNWRASFQALEKLQPKTIVPGHGKMCDPAKARKETKKCLVLLRTHMRQAIKNNVDLQTAIDTLDQSAYKSLANWDLLKGGNANRTDLEMEME